MMRKNIQNWRNFLGKAQCTSNYQKCSFIWPQLIELSLELSLLFKDPYFYQGAIFVRMEKAVWTILAVISYTYSYVLVL